MTRKTCRKRTGSFLQHQDKACSVQLGSLENLAAKLYKSFPMGENGIFSNALLNFMGQQRPCLSNFAKFQLSPYILSVKDILYTLVCTVEELLYRIYNIFHNKECNTISFMFQVLGKNTY